MSSSVATQPPAPSASPPPVDTQPRAQKSVVTRVLARPEVGALAAAIVIFFFFYAVAPSFRTLPAASTYLYASSTIGIVAVGVALLMIGGEFDLSAGVAVITSSLVASMTAYQLSVTRKLGMPVRTTSHPLMNPTASAASRLTTTPTHTFRLSW